AGEADGPPPGPFAGWPSMVDIVDADEDPSDTRWASDLDEFDDSLLADDWIDDPVLADGAAAVTPLEEPTSRTAGAGGHAPAAGSIPEGEGIREAGETAEPDLEPDDLMWPDVGWDDPSIGSVALTAEELAWLPASAGSAKLTRVKRSARR